MNTLPAWLARALRCLRRDAPSPLCDQAEMFADIGVASINALRAAQPAGGRAVVATIFALQARLQNTPSPPSFPDEAREPIAPALAVIEAIGQGGGAPRLLLTRWLDVFADRLTMARYGDPRKRRHQARALLGDTLRLLAAETLVQAMDTISISSAADPLDAFCDCALTFWDITQAQAQAEYGWDRIQAPDPESMGGYYALGETPHAPAPEDIRAAALRLLRELGQTPPPAHPVVLAPWLAALHIEMGMALTQFCETGCWPLEPASQPGTGVSLLGRIKARLRGGSS